MNAHPSNPAVQPPPVTPVFRWAGSKRKVLPLLSQYWSHGFSRYVEPFAGSAALFFRLQPPRAVLGDINQGLIDAYEVIRDRPDDVFNALTDMPRTKANYYRVRAQSPKGMPTLARAVRFVYLNRLCFNGIYRTNMKGEFNVPYAHAKPGCIPSIEVFRRCAILLSRAKLRCSEFGRVLSAVRGGDFVYLDPPYAVQSRRIFRQYDAREFGLRDLERLATHVEAIERRGAFFLLSYADCAEARRLFAKWKPRRVKVRRHIAGFASARRSAFELLITNIDR